MSNKFLNCHFTSNKDSWETPKWLFDELNDEFKFETDVCASSENTKCEKYFSKEVDGLSQKWKGVCWMNPPFGKNIESWVKKAYISSLQGATVVCLVPARTDSKWFQNYCIKGEIRFVRKRLKFVGSTNMAPFPCLIVIFKPKICLDEMMTY